MSGITLNGRKADSSCWVWALTLAPWFERTVWLFLSSFSEFILSWAIFLKKRNFFVLFYFKQSSKPRSGRGREKGVRKSKRLWAPPKLANIALGTKTGSSASDGDRVPVLLVGSSTPLNSWDALKWQPEMSASYRLYQPAIIHLKVTKSLNDHHDEYGLIQIILVHVQCRLEGWDMKP